MMWVAQHSVTGAGEPGPHLTSVLAITPSRDMGDIPFIGYFFPGCRYVFSNVQLSHLGHITNNECIGESIILDEREPPDTGEGKSRHLRFPPKAIIVRPAGPPPPAFTPDVPEGCLMVLPEYGPAHKLADAFSVKRFGFKLQSGYAVTDYYAQGLTFKDGLWIVHLTPPPKGTFARASIVVILSRYRSWDDVHLWEPLWDTAAATAPADRAAVINKFHKALQMPDRLETELKRLHTAAGVFRLQPPRVTAGSGEGTSGGLQEGHPA
jgi:hypothetical protein